MTYDYTYAIGSGNSPVEIAVKPGDELNIQVTGDEIPDQVYADTQSYSGMDSKGDVLVKAHALKEVEADGFESYTYKKYDTYAQRITIKETNRVEVTVSSTLSTAVGHENEYEKTTVTWALNEQGVLTAGSPVVEYVGQAGTGELQTTSTFKKFTAAYDGTEWVDDNGVDVDVNEPAPDSYKTVTYVSEYSFATGSYGTPGNPNAVDVADAATAIAAQTAGPSYKVFATANGVTDEGTAFTDTEQNPYDYAVNNGLYETVIDEEAESTTLFVIKNPTNIMEKTVDGTTTEVINPATIVLQAAETTIANVMNTVFDPKATVSQSSVHYLGFATNDKIASPDSDDTFKLGEGENEITLNSKLVNDKGIVVGFGNDEVELTRGEKLNLAFDEGAEVVATVAENGKDVVFSVTNAVTYYATAKVTGTAYGHDFGAGTAEDPSTLYEFALRPAHLSSQAAMADSWNVVEEGDILWYADKPYGVNADGKDTYLALDISDFGSTHQDKNDPEDVDKVTSYHTTFGGTANVTDIRIFKIENGTTSEITDSYLDGYTGTYDATNDSLAESLYLGQRAGGTVTVKDVWAEDVQDGSLFNITPLTVNGADWKTCASGYTADGFTVEPEVVDGVSSIIGTYKDENATSNKLDNAINLGTGKDKVTFKGSFGDDVVTVNENEELDLVLRNAGGSRLDLTAFEATTSGDDVVLNIKDTITLSAEVVKGQGQTGTVDGFDVTLGNYTLKLAKSGSVGAIPNKYMFQLTPSYNTGEAEAHYVYIYLEEGDFNVDTDGNVTSIKDQTIDGITLTNLKINASSSKGGVYDWTQGYYNVVKNHVGAGKTYEDVFEYAEHLYNSQVEGTVTIAGLAKEKINGATVTIDGGSPMIDDDIEDIEFNANRVVTADGVTITGSRFQESEDSSAGNDVIALGSGKDTIYFRGVFGNDTVKIADGEILRLMIEGKGQTNNAPKDAIAYSKSKNDLVINAENKYELEATVTQGANQSGTVDGYTVEQKAYTLTLAKSGSVGAQPNSYMFQLRPNYNGADAVEPHYIYIYLTEADFETDANGNVTKIADQVLDGITLTNLKLTRTTATEGTVDFAQEYYEAAKLDGFNPFTYAQNLYKSEVDGTITVKDYFKGDIDAMLKINTNSHDVGEWFQYEIAPKKKVFTGTKADDVAVSTAENETFDLKTGSDKIVLKGNFGDDKVIVSKDEVLNLSFGCDAADVKFEAKGNDIVATAKVSYYATATVTGTAYGHNFGAGTDDSPATEYTFALRGAHLSSPEAMADSWGVVDEGDILWYATDKYGVNADGKDTYLALDISDFGTAHQDKADTTNPSKITSYHTTFGAAADVTNIRIFKVVDGVETEITSSYLSGYTGSYDADNDTLARKYYNKQVNGTVTLKDFNKSDIDATVLLNGSDVDIRELPAFVEANTYNTQEAFAGGKITTKASADIIDARNYISSNGKGLTINSGSGNDTITGSNYNDKVTVKSLAGDQTLVTETSGTNKITTGKGDDTVTIGVGLSYNTIKLGAGDNTAILSGYGTNKVTGGSGKDDVVISAGFNTVNAKNGENSFKVYDGSNKLTGGKDVDNFELNGGQNTVKAGKGNDAVVINSGYNNINLGAGNDSVLVTFDPMAVPGAAFDSYNVIKGVKGNNKYELNAGTNVITGGTGVDEFVFNTDEDLVGFGVNATINGGKGNDIYDLTNADYGIDTINITDTKGKNVVKLAEKDTILFDVTLGKKAKKDKVSNLLTFRNDDGDVTYKGSIKTVVVADNDGNGYADDAPTSYSLNIKGVAEQVASFMRNELGLGKGASAYDVLAKGGENAENLLAIYNGIGMVGTDGPKYVADIYKA